MHGVVLLAAGFGTRMDNQTNDKILENIGKSNAFRMCLDAFSEFQEERRFERGQVCIVSLCQIH